MEQDEIRGDAVVRHHGGDLVPDPLLEGGAARIAVIGRCYCQYMTRFESTLYSVYLMQERTMQLRTDTRPKKQR